MSWAPILLLAGLTFALGAWALKMPRRGWALFALALLIGLAGYGWQGEPGYAGSPTARSAALAADGEPLVEARRAMIGASEPPSRFVMVADGFTRRGQYQDAAGMLRNALADDPEDGEAWLALANVLTEHGDGALTPAALYAYDEARKTLPDSPAPDYFLGVAMIRSGKLVDAEQLWAKALAASPADAPWREELALRLDRLRQLMREIAASQPPGQQGPPPPR